MTETFNPTLDRLPYRNVMLSYDIPAPINTFEHPGTYAVILHDEEVSDLLHTMYGRPGLALKCVPMKPQDARPALALWDKVELGMCSLVQNLLALEGFAPRVYGLVVINETHAAQVTDFVAETDPKDRTNELMSTFKELGVEPRKSFDTTPHKGNWRDGLFVDFSGLYMKPEAFGALVANVRQRAYVPKNTPAGRAYEEVCELGIRGTRTAAREIPERVVELSPRGHVLDLGCNLGHFSRRADRLAGAVRVVGIEKETEIAQLTRTINVLLGHWNVDTVCAKLPQDANLIPELNYGLVMCLSAINYWGCVDAVPWLSSLSPTLYFEGHGSIEASHYLAALEESYASVERLPDATDNMRRVQYFCRGGDQA